MKPTSLITTLVMLLLAVTASAQSDPSTGGSFGTSFDHRAKAGGALSGTANIGETTGVAVPDQDFESSSRNHAQTHRSFWDWLTGQNKNTPATGGSQSKRDRSHGWFGHHASSKEDLHSNRHAQSRDRYGRANVDASTNTHSSGWHIPFFDRR